MTYLNKMVVSSLLSLLLISCSSVSTDYPDHDQFIFEEPFVPEIKANKAKSIFVFIDGTGNNRKTATNVYRLFQELVSGNHDKQTVANYIEGVGTNNSPISEKRFGFGMDDRIAQGYAFIMQQYRVGDKVYLFGFSRGAYAARALAGLISYAGVLKITDQERKDKKALLGIAKEMVDLSKSASSDSHFAEQWQHWIPHTPPFLSKTIYNTTINEKTERATEPVEIEFLGLWETVPSSSTAGLLGFLGIEQYKIGSYPSIRHIAHALANDEKRSLFKPTLLDEPINKDYTQQSEMVFPGSHTDVGGGNADLNNELPNLSLTWMLNLLNKSYRFPKQAFASKYVANAKGLAHLSIADFEGNLDSHCQDRELTDISEHTSLKEREQASEIPVSVCVAMRSGIEGKSCKRSAETDGLYQTEKLAQAQLTCETIKQQKWLIE